MTWRRGEQDLQSFALPYGNLTPKDSLPKPASQTLTSFWRCIIGDVFTPKNTSSAGFDAACQLLLPTLLMYE
jgi:hypothetical protein